MADLVHERAGGDALAPLWIVVATLAVLVLGWFLFRGFASAPTDTTPNTVNNYEAPDLNIGGSGGTPAPAPAPAPAQ